MRICYNLLLKNPSKKKKKLTAQKRKKLFSHFFFRPTYSNGRLPLFKTESVGKATTFPISLEIVRWSVTRSVRGQPTRTIETAYEPIEEAPRVADTWIVPAPVAIAPDPAVETV